MSELSLSIVMCTYNGERFVLEQLESMVAQRRVPDRLLVIDDASSDNTVEIVRGFSARSPFPVELIVNERNIGFIKNFDKAIRLAQGDILVLSDQDDVWVPDKLERIEETFLADSSLWTLFTDAEVVDESLHPLGYRLWKTLAFSRTEQRQFRAGGAFRLLVKHYLATGATMAFRSRYVEQFLPIPDDCYHDAWIALVSAAIGSISCLPAPLILYRQHNSNVIGAKKRSLSERIFTAREKEMAFYKQLEQQHQTMLTELQQRYSIPNEYADLLRNKIAHLSVRRSYCQSARFARLGPILRELLHHRYHRFSNGLWSAIRDLIV